MPPSTPVEVEIRSARAIDPALREKLDRWFHEIWGSLPTLWAPPDWFAVAMCDDKIVGRLGIVERTIAAGGSTLRVGGVAGVATLPDWRNRGVASAAMRAAQQFIASQLRCEFGLLLCRREVSPVYAKLGWRTVTGPTSFMQPSGVATYPHLTMVMRFGERQWPAGPIDLRGLPW